MKYKCSILILFFFIVAEKAHSQIKDSTAVFKISGYVDAYYAYYTDSTGQGNYQKFPTISARSNQFGLNTAQINFEYNSDKVRGLATFHYGDIAKSAWSPTFNSIMEAHAGIRLCKKLWLDAGFFRTHFGTESLLPRENFESSVSVNTVYEPYFEAGARLNYQPDNKWTINIYILNGYNIYEENNNKKSLGMMISYAIGDKGNIGYSNYIGDDSPQTDSLSHLRIHQNLFFNYQLHKIKIQIGGNYGLQQHSDFSDYSKSAWMTSGVAAIRYQMKEKFAIYGRGEFFDDPKGFMAGVFTDSKNNLTGYKLWGVTFGAEYKPSENSYIRIEGRKLQMNNDQQIFYWNGNYKSYRYEMMCNIGVSF